MILSVKSHLINLTKAIRYFRYLTGTHYNKRFKVMRSSYLNPPVIYDGIKLPGFPPEQMQRDTTGHAGIYALREAFIFYKDCTDTFCELGSPLQAKHRLLDFGAGWGRITRFFLYELPPENIYGIDVMEDYVEICRKTFRSENFQVTAPFPPTNFPNEKFDYIIGCSVFSHLSEEACKRWMHEFHRLLAPAGIVALTTRGRWFFDYCESLKRRNVSGYLDALSKMFDDFSDARARYDRGEFVHSNREGVCGGGAMQPDFYGESFIPKKYAESAYENLFYFRKFLSDSTRQAQPIMFFQKK